MILFGIRDETISLIVQIMALVACFCIGLCGYRRGLPGLLIAIGIVTNVLAQVVVMGGGPGACVGFVAYPVLYLVVGFGGRGVRLLLWPETDEPRAVPACPGCGYDLTGNRSGVCPECGKPVESAER